MGSDPADRYDAPMKWRGPLLVFLIALTARALAAMTLGVIPRDGIVIVETARLVAEGVTAAAIEGVQHPLLPLLAGWLGGTETAAVAIACLFGALGALALYRIGSRLGGPACGLVAGLLGAVAPALVRYQSVPLSEAVAVPLALWALDSALAARERSTHAFTAGLLAGMAYLARPEALLLPLVLGPALTVLRRPLAGLLLLLGFAIAATPYVGYLSWDHGEFTLSRKKPAARYLLAEDGFDDHMKERSARTGYSRPGIVGAAAELGRSLGEATTWAILILGAVGIAMLMREGRSRAAAFLMLALLAADLALRFRHVHLHGYLSKRHLVFAAALLVPFAARPFVTRGRIGAVAAALLCAVLIGVAVKPRDGEKVTLAMAGRYIRTVGDEAERVGTWLTPRIPYYAHRENAKLNRLLRDVDSMTQLTPGHLRYVLRLAGARWLALVPYRLDEKTRRALMSAAAGFPSREFGSGEWRVVLYRVP